jgi:thioredoxin reductase (NADPH)
MVLSGRVDVTQHDESGRRTLIVTHGRGEFMGELAQLANRPALVDAYAQEPVNALIIPQERLQALLIAEADLGERMMRAMILRRVGLLETGAGGPVIVGRKRRRGKGADRTFQHSSRSIADCAVSRRSAAAESR